MGESPQSPSPGGLTAKFFDSLKAVAALISPVLFPVLTHDFHLSPTLSTAIICVGAGALVYFTPNLTIVRTLARPSRSDYKEN